MDITMHEPARFAAKAMSAAGIKVWLYRFTYVALGDLPGQFFGGAEHAAEVPFLFQTLARKYGPDNVSNLGQEMARKFSGYFANFAKSVARNDPNPIGDTPL